MASGSIFIRRPILASVMSIVVVIAGAVALVGLPIAQYPEITPVQVTVNASYPGADAETVANSVAAPLETRLNGVDNMIYMQSTSSATGELTITIYFEIGTDPDTAEVQVNNRVNLALPELPQSVQATGVRVEKRSATVMLLIALFSPDNRFDEKFIGNYANINVLDAIKRVKGANQASIFGMPDLAMRLWLEPDRMAGLGITPSDIQRAVSQQNELFGVGRIGQPPTKQPAEMTFPVVTEGRYSEPEQFEQIILRTDVQGAAIVRLGDIGRAEVGLKQYMLRSQVNQKTCTFIMVYEQPGSNSIEVSAGVQKLLKELKQDFPDGLDYAVSLDTTKFVTASINEVIETLVIAIILVVLVTYLFLQSIRATIIPTLAILVSVIGTFIGLTMLGFSINLLTLFGLVLAIGIVCDDAIVVVENVERNMAELGLSARDATIRAMSEVTGAVIATTLVLIAVFLPCAFMSGTTGVLYQQFATTIAVSVAISSFVALTLTPALAGVLLKPRKGPPGGLFGLFNKTLDKITVAYTASVRWSIKGWVISLILVSGMLWGTVQLFKIVPGSFVPEEDQGYILAAVMLPDGASLDRCEALTKAAADIFKEHPSVQYASALAGYSILDSQYKTNSGTVFVALKDFEERKTPGLKAFDLIRDSGPKLRRLREGIVIPINPPAIPGLGSQGGFEFWVQNRGQGDIGRLAEVTRGLMATGSQRQDLTKLNSTINAASRQLRAEVDRTKAETLGVPVQDVYNTLQTLFGSLYVSQYNKYGRVWQVILQAEPEYRENPEDINNIYVRQRDNQMVPLAALVNTSYITGPDLISRFNGFPAAKVTGDAGAGFSSGQAIAAMEEISRTNLPEGFTYAWSGQAFEEKKSGGSSAVVFVFGLVMVFLILAGQYEKWTLPIAILLAVPFGIFGALVAVWWAGMQNDVYFQVGLVTLIGLSTKNAILIVEFAQQKHEEGTPLFEAAVEAAGLRFRPVLMTALSFILGTLPLVLASGAGANARHSIGTGILGGMIGATTLALLFVPMFYWLIMSLASFGKSKPAAASAAAPDKEGN